MSWIKSKCWLLPTNDKKAPILSYLQNESLQYFPKENWSNLALTKRHLYFTSDEEIKEDDWCINANNTIVQYRQLFRDKEVCKKIIATTNKSLTTDVDGSGTIGGFYYKNLPEPSKEFLGAYIKAYNEGKPIEDVLIEYQTEWCEATMEIMEGYGDNPKDYPYVPKVKVKSDNTITIRKAKDSWNREEVIAIATKALYAKGAWYQEEINEWFEQNLQII